MQTAKKIMRSSCRYHIDFPKSVNLLQQKIEQHNLANAGDSSRKIRVTAAVLAEKLIRLYKRRFTEWQAAQLFPASLKDMPTLEINNQFLAEIMQVSDRTIRNYRARLKVLGFIEEEIWHGSCRSFEIRINPEFLFMTENGQGLRVEFKATRKKLPPTSSGTLQEQQEPVQELVGGKKREHPENFAAKAPERPAVNAPEPQEPGHGNELAGSPQESIPPAPERPEILTGQRKQLLFRHAKAILMLALSTLFKKQAISGEERQLALINIARLYANAPAGNFVKITNNYSRRLKLAEETWMRRVGYLPDIATFFDPENEQGFRQTREWLYEEEKPLSHPASLKKIIHSDSS